MPIIMPRTLAPTAGRWRNHRASSYDNKKGSSFPAPWFFGGAVVRSRSGESGGCYRRLWVEHARYGTPSPVPPPLVKARVAVHPLPQGGEGWDFFLGGVLKCRNASPRVSPVANDLRPLRGHNAAADFDGTLWIVSFKSRNGSGRGDNQSSQEAQYSLVRND